MDPSRWGSLFQGLDQLPQSIPGALGIDGNRSVRLVSDPAGQVERTCTAGNEVAIADALNATVHAGNQTPGLAGLP